MRNILCATGFLTVVDEKEGTALLVISRKVSESILIGDNIEIRISEISGDRVKLAISAPKEVRITRKELLETASINREAGEKLQAQTLAELKDLLKQKE